MFFGATLEVRQTIAGKEMLTSKILILSGMYLSIQEQEGSRFRWSRYCCKGCRLVAKRFSLAFPKGVICKGFWFWLQALVMT